MIAGILSFISGRAMPWIASLAIAGVGTLTAYVYHVKLDAADTKVAALTEAAKVKDGTIADLQAQIVQITADARAQKKRADKARTELAKVRADTAAKSNAITTEIQSHATAKDDDPVSPGLGAALAGVCREYGPGCAN